MSETAAIAGFLNFHKPLGWTSHDAVAQARRWFQTRKVGHAGTLDPAATGVLPIAIGRATRLIPFLAEDKAYRAVIRFGLTTTTDDREGAIMTQMVADHLDLSAIQAVLPQFIGSIRQIPPQYSAIQVDGQRLYDLARRGTTVAVPERTVQVHQITPIAWVPGPQPELTVDIDCGAGTYIRAIARDLGQAVGTGATLAALTRTRSGGFTLAASYSLDNLQAMTPTELPLTLLAPAQGLQHLPALTLPRTEAERWQRGQRRAISLPLPLAPYYRIYGPDGAAGDRFLGISRCRLEPVAAGADPIAILSPQMVFCPAVGALESAVPQSLEPQPLE